MEAAPELAEAASTDEAIVSRRLERMSRNDNQLQIAFTPEGLPLWPALRMVVVFPALLGGFAWKLGQEIAFASPNRGLPPWALLPPVFGGWILLVAVEILPKLMKHTLMIGPDRLDLTATLGSVSRTRRLDRSKARAVGIRDASDGRAAIFCWIAKQPITLIAGLLESEAEAILREILRSQPDLDEGQA